MNNPSSLVSSETTEPQTSVPPAESVKGRAEQDQEMANDITDAAQMINTAQTDSAVAAILAERGIDAEDLAKGAALHAAAQRAFNRRQTAKGSWSLAVSTAGDAESAARQYYVDFREIARTDFRADGDRVQLGLTGRVPKDLEKFITTATASYTVAKSDRYAAVLAKRKYKAEELTTALNALKLLADLNSEQDKAEGEAQAATKARNEAHAALMDWVKRFRKVAKVALRGQPGLRTKLKM